MVIRQLVVFGDTVYAGTDVRNGFNINSGLYFSTDSGLSWTQLDSTLGDGSIIDLEFLPGEKNTFYLVKGESPYSLGGYLYKTTNSGMSWEIIPQLENISLDWVSISSFNNNEIYAKESHYIPAGWYETVYRSTDGGSNWQEITYLPASSHGRSMAFNLSLTDSNKLYAAVDDRLLDKYFFISTDKGDSWIYISEPPGVPSELMNDSEFPERIYMSSLYISKDGGYTWEIKDSGLPDTSYYLSFYQSPDNTNEIYTLRTDGLYKSDKENIYWNRTEGTEILPLAFGIGGFITLDRGLLKNIVIDNNLNKMYVGTGYGIYKRDYVSEVVNSQPETANNFNLEQNYPNPFNPKTKIKFSLAVRSHILINVFDLPGNKVKTLMNKEMPAGNYEVEFVVDGLPSGVYFYTMITEQKIFCKKMLLIK